MSFSIILCFSSNITFRRQQWSTCLGLNKQPYAVWPDKLDCSQTLCMSFTYPQSPHIFFYGSPPSEYKFRTKRILVYNSTPPPKYMHLFCFILFWLTQRASQIITPSSVFRPPKFVWVFFLSFNPIFCSISSLQP